MCHDAPHAACSGSGFAQEPKGEGLVSHLPQHTNKLFKGAVTQLQADFQVLPDRESNWTMDQHATARHIQSMPSGYGTVEPQDYGKLQVESHRASLVPGRQGRGTRSPRVLQTLRRRKADLEALAGMEPRGLDHGRLTRWPSRHQHPWVLERHLKGEGHVLRANGLDMPFEEEMPPLHVDGLAFLQDGTPPRHGWGC